MKDNNRNFILAIVLSMTVLFGWQFFIAGPQIEQARKQQEIAAQQAAEQANQQPAAAGDQAASGGTAAGGTTAAPAAGSAPTAGPVRQTVETREEALAQSRRVPIATPAITGSINLTGGRVDDIRLNNFHETVEPTSPTIVLLSPNGGPDAYFADFGWVGAADAGQLPGSTTEWTAPAGAKLTITTPVTLTYDNGAGLTFTRQIAIDDQFMLTVTDSVANKGDAAVALSPFGCITRVGEPHVSGYWILHEGLVGVIGAKGLQEYTYKDTQKDHEVTWTDITGGWLGIADKYWAATLIPDQTQAYTARYVGKNDGTPVYQTDFTAAAENLAPGATISQTSRLFAGAKQVSVLSKYGDALGIEKFDLLIDWGWFFITPPMFLLIDWLYRLAGNFGVAILLVTVMVKAVFFPLANRSYKSMSQMKKLQPQMTALREQYKDDKVKQQEALMLLYKTEKINPLAGCWPMVIQIPVFFALYKVLFVTIEMRHAPFFGWISDLSAPDPTHIFNLFGLLPYDPAMVPLIGQFLAIGIWPVIMGITMFVQMKLNPTPPDPTQAMLFTWMPVLFTFMLASFPAGLVIYWAWNNTLSVTQQYIIMRRSGTEVNLFGNILETFGLGKKKPAHAAQPAKPAPAAPKAANDSAKPQAETAKAAKSTVKSRRAAARAKAKANAGVKS
jgi:YidC/Oxa1 family membrane protein insertase